MTTEATIRDITIVTVCYNSMAVLPAMLGSIPPGVPVVVVDNGSAEAQAQELTALAEARGARLVRNETNRGFGPACNQGAALADTPFLLFLNPDAALTEGALEGLLEGAARYPRASAMNPRLEDSSPYFKRGSVLLPRAAHLPRGWPEADCEVPVLSGAAFFVRRGDFQAVGGFDEKIFLYHEDDDLSLRLAAARGPLMFLRAPLVRHLGGHSSMRSPEVAGFKARMMGQSRVYTARKHRVRFGAAKALASALGQLASPLVLLSRRKRAKQMGFLRGVLAGMRGKG